MGSEWGVRWGRKLQKHSDHGHRSTRTGSTGTWQLARVIVGVGLLGLISSVSSRTSLEWSAAWYLFGLSWQISSPSWRDEIGKQRVPNTGNQESCNKELHRGIVAEERWPAAEICIYCCCDHVIVKMSAGKGRWHLGMIVRLLQNARVTHRSGHNNLILWEAWRGYICRPLTLLHLCWKFASSALEICCKTTKNPAQLHDIFREKPAAVKVIRADDCFDLV